MNRFVITASSVALVATTFVGCTDNASSDDATKVAVTSSNDTCELSATEAAAGTIVFTVKNDGDNTTEFYVLEEDGETIVNEVEDIGPGLTRDMTIDVETGTYVTRCEPSGGEEVTDSFTVN